MKIVICLSGTSLEFNFNSGDDILLLLNPRGLLGGPVDPGSSWGPFKVPKARPAPRMNQYRWYVLPG